jgi:hypothetical protein
MKEVLLTQGFVTVVDDEDFDRVNQFRWVVLKNKNNCYAWSRQPHPGKKTYLQNFLMHPPSGFLVDHINRNGLDNRKQNLRICTPRQNTHNRPSHGKLSYKGVVFCKSKKNPYMVRLHADKQWTYLGCFPTAELAAEAYDRKAFELYGEFAYLNFPDKFFSKSF